MSDPGASSARILIAEDDEPQRQFAQRALALDGHRVEAVADGIAALAALRGAAFDLLLTDIQMPGMDGIELALLVGREQPRLPIILMTGFAAQKERARNLDALLRGVVLKPFSIEEIRATVRRALLPAA